MNEKDFRTKASRNEQDVIEFYDQYAEDWDRRFDKTNSTRLFLEQRWQSFENILNKSELSGNALELGVGTGAYIERTSQMFTSILAVDGSANMVRRLEEKLAANHIMNVTALQSNVLDMAQLQDASFDAIYFFGLIEHIINVDAFMVEIRRLLKKDGLVVGVTPNRRCPWYAIRKLVRKTGKHCSSDTYYVEEEVLQLFEKHGFTAERIEYWVYFRQE